METKESAGSAGFFYLLGGLIVGAAAGVLLAPKSGSATREDIEEWTRRNRKKTQSLLSSIRDAIPLRVKAAAGFGAVKNGAGEAYEMSKDKAKEFVGS